MPRMANMFINKCIVISQESEENMGNDYSNFTGKNCALALFLDLDVCMWV